VRTGGDKGAPAEIWKTSESVKIVTVFLSFQNNKIKVMVSSKCYDSFVYISIMNLQSTDRQCIYNVTLRHVRASIVAVEKQ
jgi:hypothetical protein